MVREEQFRQLVTVTVQVVQVLLVALKKNKGLHTLHFVEDAQIKQLVIVQVVQVLLVALRKYDELQVLHVVRVLHAMQFVMVQVLQTYVLVAVE